MASDICLEHAAWTPAVGENVTVFMVARAAVSAAWCRLRQGRAGGGQDWRWWREPASPSYHSHSGHRSNSLQPTDGDVSGVSILPGTGFTKTWEKGKAGRGRMRYCVVYPLVALMSCGGGVLVVNLCQSWESAASCALPPPRVSWQLHTPHTVSAWVFAQEFLYWEVWAGLPLAHSAGFNKWLLKWLQQWLHA